MEHRLFEVRNEQREQQSHPLPMNSLAKRGGVLTMLKQVSPAESLQRLMMQQARSQSGGL